MNEKTAYKPILAIGILVMLTVVGLSGCVNNQNMGNDVSKFIGTWTGEKEISMFGGRSSIITQLTFTQDAIQATLTNDQGSSIMNYTFTIQGNALTLEPTFNGGGGFSGRQSPNGTRLWNDTQTLGNSTWGYGYNGTQPWNGTQPPGDSTWPRNDSNRPPNGERPSISILFDFSFSEDYNVLYLDESRFTRV
ncbi:MAG: hypothetical protein NT038_07075 [Euryarchaeota archaeon]|nr:hypothetical protein [Euryarchaeota archaeon]